MHKNDVQNSSPSVFFFSSTNMSHAHTHAHQKYKWIFLQIHQPVNQFIYDDDDQTLASYTHTPYPIGKQKMQSRTEQITLVHMAKAI